MRWILLFLSFNCFGYDKFQTFCLTQNIYHEARGESVEGKIAIGHVTLNRINHEDFPNNVCDVVYDTCQFSWSCANVRNKPIDLDEWKETEKIAKEILQGKHENPVEGSVYYYNPRKSAPSWRRKYCSKYIDIENHRFCLS